MPKLLIFTLEVSEPTFYIVNNLIDIIFAVLMATFYTILLNARETKLFLFILACCFLVVSVVTFVYYIIDDTYVTLWHKRYFQVRMVMAAVIMVLFISALVNFFLDGKEIWVLLTSFGFLLANVLLTFIVVWSSQMVFYIKRQLRIEQMEERRLKEFEREARSVHQSALEKRSAFEKRGSHIFYPKDAN